MPGIVEASVRDVGKTIAAIDVLNRNVDRATLTALKKSQTVAKRYVKKEFVKSPRWSERGPIGRDGKVPGVNLGSPRHRPRGGGPGILTGHLQKAVGVVKRPKRKGPFTFEGGIGVGGPSSITNLYRKEVNADYPFIKPGVDKAEPAMGDVYKAEWAKATVT
jgi:hypothetical protein